VRRLTSQLDRFFFAAESDQWLSLLRIGLSLQVILYCWSLRADWSSLLSENGNALIGRDLTEALLDIGGAWVPRLGWLVNSLRPLGLNEQFVLKTTWTLLALAGGCLGVGLLARPAAMTAWLLHLCAAQSGQLFTYGMDNFTSIGLFYLMLAPLPDRWSLDYRLGKGTFGPPQVSVFFRRALQLHLCVSYFFGGLTKSAGLGWWNGLSIWRALISPPFNLIRPEILISWKFLLPIMAITVCLLETGYPLFIWIRQTRAPWLCAILAMHLGIGLAMGLHLFAFVMITLNLAAFAPEFAVNWGQRNPARPVDGSVRNI
jgi:Vitamin K-dependent gamma-carboxylase